MLKDEIHEGITELSCHPGYSEPGPQSGYSIEREVELQTLCDPIVRKAVGEQQIRLISYADLMSSGQWPVVSRPESAER